MGGFGNHLARPLFREVDTTQLGEAEAVKLMEDALRVCYYRDKNSINKFQIGKVTAEGVSISEPYSLSTDWNFQSSGTPRSSPLDRGEPDLRPRPGRYAYIRNPRSRIFRPVLLKCMRHSFTATFGK